MRISLTVLRCPDAVVPEMRVIEGGECSLGRGPGVDWVLPDPDKVLSKRHCVLGFRGGVWHLADTSTNGTFLNREDDPLGPSPRPLRDGDRLRLGNYEIELRAVEAPQVRGPAQPGYQPGYQDDPFAPVAAGNLSGSLSMPARTGPSGGDAFANPFAEPADPGWGALPSGPVRSLQGGFDGGHGTAGGVPPGGLPANFDPFGPDDDFGLGARVQPDHSPAIEQAISLPRPVAAPLPENWLDDEPLSPPVNRAPPIEAPPAPPSPPVAEPPPLANPFASEPPDTAQPMPPPSVAAPTPFPPDAAAPEPAATPPQALGAQSAAPPPPTVDHRLLAAFLRGAGLSSARPPQPEVMMEALGEAFRAMVSGVRDVLIARADVKGEFRIEQTMVRARGNNPLKFSIGDDDALTALLGTGRPIDMTPAVAVADALKDIKLHELASLVAMQAAVRTLLATFDPAKLRADAEAGGGLKVLPGQRRARAFDAFEALYARTEQALSDDFDSVFGKAFARAYEQALRDIDQRDINQRESGNRGNR